MRVKFCSKDETSAFDNLPRISLDGGMVSRHLCIVTVAENISPEYWNWVRNLIRDIELQEQCDAFLARFGQWDVGVREFRKIELVRMIRGEPTDVDFRFHAICLHMLLAIGHSLILQSEKFEKGDFAHSNFEHEHIQAYVQELEQSYREWHHGFTDAEIMAAQAKIFGATA